MLDEGTFLLSRSLPLGGEEIVVVGGVEKPVTDRAEEFARILEDAQKKQIVSTGGTIFARKAEGASCVGIHPGVAVHMRYEIPIGGAFAAYSCAFMMAKRGYLVRTSVTESRVEDEQPLLDRILSAADFGPER
ncbi:MAG TPA: hypothetical protein VK841_17205 [Polyangiaceae bacterium]|nr:hypothetical protein [Polyangiaceae bacterium]